MDTVPGGFKNHDDAFEWIEAQLLKNIPGSDLQKSSAELLSQIHFLQGEFDALQKQNLTLLESASNLEIAKNEMMQLFHTMPVGLLNLSCDGKVLKSNHKAAEILGSSRDTLYDRQFEQYLLPEHRSLVCEEIAKTSQHSSVTIIDLQILRAVGPPKWVRLLASKEGSNDQCQVILIERESPDHDMDDSAPRLEDCYQQIFDNNPLIMVLWNLEQNIVGWNSQAEAVFGWKKSEIIGKSFVETLVSPKEREGIRGRLLEFLGENFNRSHTSWNVTKTNEMVFCEWHHAMLYGSSGVCDTIISVGTNITRRDQAEREVQEQRRVMDALFHAVAALNIKQSVSATCHQIFDQIARVIVYDSINIMMMDGEQVTMFESRGNEDLSINNPMHQNKINLHQSRFFEQMLETGKPMIGSNLVINPRWFENHAVPGFRCYVGAPLTHYGKIIGFLNLASLTSGYFKEKDAEILQMFATIIAVAVENARLVHKSQDDTIVDELTGLYNRRGLWMLGKAAFERAKRRGDHFAVLFLDIDHFKEMNETYGRECCDQVLGLLSEECYRVSRAEDFVGRYDGDSFVFLMSGEAAKGGEDMAENFRTKIESNVFSVLGNNSHLTVSAGLAHMDKETLTFEELWEKADMALYRAKKDGRNCVCIYDLDLDDR